MPVHCVFAVTIHGIKKPEITNHFSRLLDRRIVPPPPPREKKGKTLLDIILMFSIIGMVIRIIFEALNDLLKLNWMFLKRVLYKKRLRGHKN